jgi:Spo7-like protein
MSTQPPATAPLNASGVDPNVQLQDLRLLETYALVWLPRPPHQAGRTMCCTDNSAVALLGFFLGYLRPARRNIKKSVASLQQLRNRYIVVVGLLVGSSGFWTYQLQYKLAESAASSRSVNDLQSVRLWVAWALLGVAPLVFFFAAGVYHSTIVEPSRFVHRLNTSLSRFHLAYAKDRAQLLRVDPVPLDISMRKPLRIRTPR